VLIIPLTTWAAHTATAESHEALTFHLSATQRYDTLASVHHTAHDSCPQEALRHTLIERRTCRYQVVFVLSRQGGGTQLRRCLTPHGNGNRL